MHMGDPIPESLIAVVEIFGGKETSSVPSVSLQCLTSAKPFNKHASTNFIISWLGEVSEIKYALDHQVKKFNHFSF